ncbi:MAG: ATP-binding protein [Balneola sp.]
MRFSFPAFLATFILFLIPSSLLSQFYPAETYSTSDGMPTNSVYSITQAENRVMWFITSKGVVTYDASEWFLFPDSLALPLTKQSYIQNDDSGRIWVAGYNESGFTVQNYKEKEWTKVITPDSWPNNRKAFSFRAAKKQIFLGLENQLFILNESHSEWRVKQIQSGSKTVTINDLVYLDDKLFITTNQGVYEFHDGEIIESELNNFNLRSRNILTINKFQDAFYFLGLNWIGKVEDNRYSLVSDELGIFSESDIKKYSLEIDDRGRVFYSSYSRASVLNEETGRWIPLKILGRQQNVLSNQIFVDQEKNYWVGDNRGLFKFNLLRFKNLNSNTGLIEDEVSSIYQTLDGKVLLANPRGINFYDKGEIKSIDLRNRYPDFVTRVLDIEQTADESIYVALSQGGLISIKNGRIRDYDSKTLNNLITAISVHNGELLVSSSNAVYIFKDQKLELFGEFHGIRNIVSLDDDKLAILSYQGLYISEGTNTRFYSSTKNSLNSTFDIEYWNGNYVVATQAGLGILKNEKIVDYEDISVPAIPSYSLMKDSGNNLWVGTNDGIFRVNEDQTIQYNKKNGLIGNEINRNALIEDLDGDIWIGTDAGVSVFDHNEDIEADYIPIIELKELKTLSGTDFTDKSQKNINYNENSIELKFRTISFFNEEAMNFRYKLEGFDEEWNSSSDISKSPIRYTNLNPGSYTLLVQGQVEAGPWSAPHQVGFVVEHPFYQTPWFISLVLLFIIVIAYSVYRMRVLFLIKQRATLKNLVSRRTEEIDMQNRNLKEAYSNLEEAHIKLVQTEKMAALGVLTAGVAHEINNPLNYIKAGKDIVKQIAKQTESSILIEDKETFETVLSGIDLGVEKILNITRSLGSFSSTSDKLDSTVHLNKILDETLIILEHELRGRIKVIRRYESQDTYVVGNEGKLYQVFSNLVLNSIHAIEGKGEIIISTQVIGDDILISINDTGKGISEEVRKKIFDPFFTTKEQGKGTGLGLSIVYNIIKELNGDIEIDSAVDNGTTVKIKLKKDTLRN